MKKIFFLSLFVTSLCMAADGVVYKDAIVITHIKSVEQDGLVSMELDLPFHIYGYNVVMNGRDITDYLYKQGNPGKLEDGSEVLAKVDYKAEDQEVVDMYQGKFGFNPVKDPIYLKHYPIKNEDKYAYTKEDGTIEKYKGEDKDDLAPFCEALSFKKVIDSK